MIEEFTPLTIDEFNGDFNRAFNRPPVELNRDTIPPGHFYSSTNIDFDHFGIKTRAFAARWTGHFTARANVVQIFSYIDNVGAFKYIVSVNDGVNCKLYINNGATEVYSATIANWLGTFTAIQIGQNIYFSPDYTIGSTPILIFNPNTVNPARPIAGVGPATGVTAANGAAGNVDVGLHLIAVAYETSSGFITKPNSIPTQYTAPGGLSINLTNIPIGPAGIVARHILVTKTIASYSGNINDYEFFKVARLGNNVSTTLTINFFDSDLLDSADSLFDLLETIPNCRKLTRYRNRLVCIGELSNTNIIRISNPNDYESFDSINSIIILNPNVPGGFQDGVELNDLLYLITGNAIVSTRDNGDFPNTWEINLVDPAYRYEIATQLSDRKKIVASLSTNNNALENAVILVAEMGLLLFRGGIQDELSWKITNEWENIHRFIEDILIDTSIKQIYILYRDTSDSFFYKVKVCDYKNGLDKQNVRWTTWNFNTITSGNKIHLLLYNNNILRPSLGFVNIVNDLFLLDDSHINDKDANDINVRTLCDVNFSPLQLDKNIITSFNYLILRVRGSNNLICSIRGEDNNIPNPDGMLDKTINLSLSPGEEITTGFNFLNEKAFTKIALQMDGNTPNGYFKLKSLVLYAARAFGMRNL